MQPKVMATYGRTVDGFSERMTRATPGLQSRGWCGLFWYFKLGLGVLVALALVAGALALLTWGSAPAGAQDVPAHLRQQCSAPGGPPAALVDWCARGDAMLARAARTGTMATTGPSGGDLPPVSCADVQRMGFCPWNTCWTVGQCEMVGSGYPLKATCDRDRAYEAKRVECRFGRCIDPDSGRFAVDALCDAVPPAGVCRGPAGSRPYQDWRTPTAAAVQAGTTLALTRAHFWPWWQKAVANAPLGMTAQEAAQWAISCAMNDVDAGHDPTAPTVTGAMQANLDGMAAVLSYADEGGQGDLWTGAGCEPEDCPPPVLPCPDGQTCMEPWSCETDCPVEPPPTGEVLVSVSHVATEQLPAKSEDVTFPGPRSFKHLRYTLTASLPASTRAEDDEQWRTLLMAACGVEVSAFWPKCVTLYALVSADGTVKVRAWDEAAEKWRDQKKKVSGWRPARGGEVTGSFDQYPDRVEGWVEVAGFPRISFRFDVKSPMTWTEARVQWGNGHPKELGHDRVWWPGCAGTVAIEVAP